MLDPSGAQPDALGSERSIARCARLQAQDMGRPAPGRAHVNPVWAPGHSQVRPPSGLDGRELRRRTRPSSVPAALAQHPPPHYLSPAPRARGLSGRQPGPWGPCCPCPARRGPTSRSRPLSARDRLHRGRGHLPLGGSSARVARSGPSALTHARSR